MGASMRTAIAAGALAGALAWVAPALAQTGGAIGNGTGGTVGNATGGTLGNTTGSTPGNTTGGFGSGGGGTSSLGTGSGSAFTLGTGGGTSFGGGSSDDFDDELAETGGGEVAIALGSLMAAAGLGTRLLVTRRR